MLKYTRISDPQVYEIVAAELNRQEHNIEMIASESTAPLEVMELSGCVFTNKTTEGYPGARFQAGSQEADRLETLAIKRAKAVFGAEHANLQVYSGSTANYGVYSAILTPGDTVLSMRLDQGGHLTHGSPVNFLSKVYNYIFYGVDPQTEQIDYDSLTKIARDNKPKLIIAGGSSYPRLIDYKRIGEIAKEVGAYLMVDMAHVAGLVAAGVIPSPVPYADFVSSSTTKTFCGPRSGLILCKAEYAKKLDKGVFPGSLGSVHLNTLAAKAFSLQYITTPKFRAIMQQVVVNAKKLAAELAGLGFRIVSGGTDNHIVLVDLRPKGISGKVFQNALEKVGITVNKNMIPFDPESPFVTSGVRIGLTSTSQRGLKEPDIAQIAAIMNQVAAAPEDPANLDACKAKAAALIARFPLYPPGSFGD
jgi:glycine hydroxymethyltransferase